MPADEWPRIAVVGAGAVGCYFGGLLARAGAPVTLIGWTPHVEAITRDGLAIESAHFQQQVPVVASTRVEAVRDAVDKRYPGATLKEVMEINEVKDGKDRLEGYEIVLETADKKGVEVTVAPDGKILEDSTDPKKDE